MKASYSASDTESAHSHSKMDGNGGVNQTPDVGEEKTGYETLIVDLHWCHKTSHPVGGTWSVLAQGSVEDTTNTYTTVGSKKHLLRTYPHSAPISSELAVLTTRSTRR